jgi:predicted nucleotidyltransferase
MRTLEETAVISERDKALLLEVKALIRQFLPTATVLLFGSAARGTRGPESDYDILILTDEPVPKALRRDVENVVLALEFEHEVVLSTFYHTKEEWGTPLSQVTLFHREVERDAVIL